MKARTLISDVLQDIGVLGVGDYLQDEDATKVLRTLNRWIDLLALEPLMIYYVLRSVRTLTSGVASFTIGTGGALNIVRPDRVLSASLIIDSAANPTTEVPVKVFTQQEWSLLPQKGLRSPLVQGIYYDRNWAAGLATLNLWPVPTVGTTQLVLNTEQALTGFADLDTTYTFPPGYEEFLHTGLVLRAAPGFRKQVTDEQRAQAREARVAVKRANIRPVESFLPAGTPGLAGGAYDWRTDETR